MYVEPFHSLYLFKVMVSVRALVTPSLGKRITNLSWLACSYMLAGYASLRCPFIQPNSFFFFFFFSFLTLA